MKLSTLKKQAAQYSVARGHTLGRWQSFDHRSMKGASATCACGMRVQILENPAANEIDVGGNAVAIQCPNK